MTIPPAFLDEIRARVPLAEVIGRRVRLKKRGREHEGLCPFHNEKTPSFTVSEQKGFFHCFGCGAHGDVLGFVMRSEGLSFPEAVEKLAAEAGLSVPQSSPEERARQRRSADLLEVLEQATQWFEQQLAGAEGSAARAYLEQRGVSPATTAAFRLGFALDRRGALRKAMNAKGIGDSQQVEAGLLKLPEDGGAPRDYFFDRVIFPIADRRGRIIAFGGRALGESKAKYLNSPETALFHKGRVLYNLARARQAAHDSGELIVTEGYMDVIALSQAGFPGAVAPLGTALTEAQIAELWRLAREPVICLDGDAAGRRAGLRAALTALPALAPDRSLRFALLPEGEDPDSLLASQGAAALRRTLDAAPGLAELLWLMGAQGREHGTPERQAGLWQSLQEQVAGIRSPEVQHAYRQAMERRFEAAFGYNPRTGRRAFAAGAGRPAGAPRGLVGRRPPAGWGPAAGRAAGRVAGRSVGKPAVGLATAGGLGLRRSPGALRHRREQALLAAAINHPEILAEYAEDLAGLKLLGAELGRLSRALVDAVSEAPDLETADLKCHLSEQGFSRLLEGLLSRQVYDLEPWVRPDTPVVEVRPKWVHFLALQRERQAELEAMQAMRLLAEETSEERLAWLRARQRSVEGGESRRVEFDPRETAEPGESS
jgi:DNA primase